MFSFGGLDEHQKVLKWPWNSSFTKGNTALPFIASDFNTLPHWSHNSTCTYYCFAFGGWLWFSNSDFLSSVSTQQTPALLLLYFPTPSVQRNKTRKHNWHEKKKSFIFKLNNRITFSIAPEVKHCYKKKRHLVLKKNTVFLSFIYL